MGEIQMKLTAEESRFLTEVLEWELRDRKIEEHRTRTPSYREGVIHQEELIASLLRKLKPAAAA